MPDWSRESTWTATASWYHVSPHNDDGVDVAVHCQHHEPSLASGSLRGGGGAGNTQEKELLTFI